MENTYFTKKIDSLGRVVIPKEIRNYLNIFDQNLLNISIINESIVLKKASNQNHLLKDYMCVAKDLSKEELNNLNLELNNIINLYR